jgi:hypothetical protein
MIHAFCLFGTRHEAVSFKNNEAEVTSLGFSTVIFIGKEDF